MIGPESDDGQHRWYFSLNNRRLWVLKRCREEGLLQSTKHQILVRVRKPKSQSEKERYTIAKCAVEAKIIPEKGKMVKTLRVEDSRNTDTHVKREDLGLIIPDQMHSDGDDNGSSSDENNNDCDQRKRNESNRYSTLF